MTARRQPSSRCLLAGSRDTANESRYDVGLLLFQCLGTAVLDGKAGSK
ncbi:MULTISPECIES: hypothetical protein [unclassified Wolbachia]|nr:MULTISPECIES: hypothetical protein [unclassified Wolbachia]